MGVISKNPSTTRVIWIFKKKINKRGDRKNKNKKNLKMLFIVTLIAGRGLSSQHRLWLINTIIFIELRVYSSDVYWMNRAGVLNVTIPLKLSTYLVNETDYLPWSTALRHLRKLDSLLSFRTARRALHCFVRNLVTPLYNTLGWNTTSPHIQRSVYLLSIQRRPKQNKNRTKKK